MWRQPSLRQATAARKLQVLAFLLAPARGSGGGGGGAGISGLSSYGRRSKVAAMVGRRRRRRRRARIGSLVIYRKLDWLVQKNPLELRFNPHALWRHAISIRRPRGSASSGEPRKLRRGAHAMGSGECCAGCDVF
ncbi:hypothetical protein NL676_015413 [Syzygium grande]|nr:hypothetical protein NL676_015413 [Syzygium grande]